MSRIYAIVLLIACLSCSKEETGPTVSINPEFNPYVERFINEAAQRGIEIDFSDTGMIIEFGTVPDDAGAVCKRFQNNDRGNYQIVVGRDTWRTSTDLQRERLIFHELGHCELSRGHRNDKLANGEWASLMRGAPIPTDCSPVVNFTGIRRAYYVNELFGEANTFAPDWADIRMDYEEMNTTDNEVILQLENVTSFEEILTIGSAESYEIEVEFRLEKGVSFAGIAFGGTDISNSYQAYYFGRTDFYIGSGSEVRGLLKGFENFKYKSENFHILTIRKIGQDMYFFMDKEFLYYIDNAVSRGKTLQSIEGEGVEVEYQQVIVRKL